MNNKHKILMESGEFIPPNVILESRINNGDYLYGAIGVLLEDGSQKLETIEGDGEVAELPNDPELEQGMEEELPAMGQTEYSDQEMEAMNGLSAESSQMYKEAGQGAISPEELLKVEIAQTETTFFTTQLYDSINKILDIIGALLQVVKENKIVTKLEEYLNQFELLRDFIFVSDINTIYYTFSINAINFNNFIETYIKEKLNKNIKQDIRDGDNDEATDTNDDLRQLDKNLNMTDNKLSQI